MEWDLGPQGIGLLLLMSLGFGVAAQLLFGWGVTRWMWLITAAVYFVAGLFISEVWFGWATQEELQPNVNGLSTDEVLLIGIIPWLATALLVRSLVRRRRTQMAHA